MDAGCSPSLGLYCNLTGQDVVVNNGLGSLKPGICYCQPYYYYVSSTTGCMPQLLNGITCNSTAYPGQCLDQSGLYCDSLTSKCKCLANYYWDSTTSKCRMSFKLY